MNSTTQAILQGIRKALLMRLQLEVALSSNPTPDHFEQEMRVAWEEFMTDERSLLRVPGWGPADDDHHCVDCRFWRDAVGQVPPTCHRHAPRTVGLRFPPMESFEWCGEWEQG